MNDEAKRASARASLSSLSEVSYTLENKSFHLLCHSEALRSSVPACKYMYAPTLWFTRHTLNINATAIQFVLLALFSHD